MAILIKNKRVTDDPWVKIENSDLTVAEAPCFSILPVSAFSDVHDGAPIQRNRLGAWFNADVELSSLTSDVLSLPLLCINVDDFNHGQIFSLAVMIKQRCNYQGELRAIGNLALDQLPYLQRCGVDAFSLTQQSDCEYALFLLQQTSYSSRFQHQLIK